MNKTIYDLELSLLTPLHIGNGDTLTLGFDYAVHDKRTWIIDQEGFADYVLTVGDGRFERMVQGVPPAKLLQPEDFHNSRLFRYVLPGLPHRGDTGVEILTHIKNVYDQPYIPGSSLKGALRTAVFRQAFQEAGQPLQPRHLGRSRSWAARDLEQDLLTTATRRGQSPNFDLLRALQVTDSSPAATDKQPLFLAKARVFGQDKVGAPINAECLRADTTLQATLTIDDYLFEDKQASLKLQFGSRRRWLTNLAAHINEQTRQRVIQEIAFYQQRREPGRAGNFYEQLQGLIEQMPANRFLIQVGWGGGWDSKTLAYLLPPITRDNVVIEYRLARNYFKAGETPFPRTRRAIGRGSEEQIQPVLPLGWILVEMKQR